MSIHQFQDDDRGYLMDSHPPCRLRHEHRAQPQHQRRPAALRLLPHHQRHPGPRQHLDRPLHQDLRDVTSGPPNAGLARAALVGDGTFLRNMRPTQDP
jgi:hypothetical protein